METTAYSTRTVKGKVTGRKMSAGGGTGLKGKLGGEEYFRVGTGRRTEIENLIIAHRKWDFATKNKVLKFIAKVNAQFN